MVELQLDQRRPKAESVAQRLEQKQGMKRAKREFNGQLLCGDFVH
jgi:hypothetical protein